MKSRKQQCAAVVAMVLAMCGATAAEEVTTQMQEVVVTATRDEVPLEQVGSSITVVTAKEIEQTQARTVADVLRSVPGLDVSRSGAFGTTSIFMRGAKSEHTLVLIDGIEMNDPSAAGGGYEFANLTVDSIERIEILRGPQSTLYGSSAMGGVINIITKKGQGALKGYISAEGGSFNTAKETAGISGSTTRFRYALNASRFDTQGISAANSAHNNPEKDGYWNSSVSAHLGITPVNNFELDLSLKYIKSKTEIDGGWGTVVDAYDSHQKSEELYAGVQARFNLFNSFLEQKIGATASDISREYNAYNSTYDGQTTKIDWQSILHLHATNDLTVGVERKDEQAKTDSMQEKDAGTTSYYLQDQISLFDAWFTTLGVRIDDHSQFGTKATYRLTTAYLMKTTDTTIKGSYGTGYKAPSLIQLYHPTWGGNANLKPEESVGWDVGVEQGLPLFNSRISATYFRNKYDDMITWDNTFMYANVAKSHTEGAELTVSMQPADNILVKGAYTYTETLDDSTGMTTSGKQLARRPNHKASLDAAYNVTKTAHLNLGIVYVGSRYNDAANTQKMGDYTLVNLAGSYDVTKNLQIFGRVDNLFDREYEEVAGYGTPGISAFGGVKVSF